VLIDTLYHAIESKNSPFDSIIPVLLRFQTISEHKKRAPERYAPASLVKKHENIELVLLKNFPGEAVVWADNALVLQRKSAVIVAHSMTVRLEGDRAIRIPFEQQRPILRVISAQEA